MAVIPPRQTLTMHFCNIKGQTAKKHPVIPEGHLTQATTAAFSFGGVKDMPSWLYPTPHCLVIWKILWCAVLSIQPFSCKQLSHAPILPSASHFYSKSVQRNLGCNPGTQMQDNLARDPLSLYSIPLMLIANSTSVPWAAASPTRTAHPVSGLQVAHKAGWRQAPFSSLTSPCFQTLI